MRRSRISSHVMYDDPSHYFFARSSGLPPGYFDAPRVSRLGRAVIVAIVTLAALLLMAWARG